MAVVFDISSVKKVNVASGKVNMNVSDILIDSGADCGIVPVNFVHKNQYLGRTCIIDCACLDKKPYQLALCPFEIDGKLTKKICAVNDTQKQLPWCCLSP